ncbi:hypothetical protein FB451DRAFT_1195762 [Mycena latifolia]|nr:hypothetical protein FB451DRAFT_1195762 [Mycena latifolia]
MGLDPSTAQIGFKWDNEKSNIPVHGLLTAADWKDCLESGIGQTERARTRKVACLIKNLNLPQETAAVAKTGKKRKVPGTPSSPSSNGKKTFDYTKEYRELKNHLACVAHKDHLCYVHSDGHHIHVEPTQTSLWAKEISVGNATKARPPENIMFQDFFLPERKKARTTRSESSTNPCTPTIHVTVNTGGPSRTISPPSPSPSTQALLAPIMAATANAANIDIPRLFTSQSSPIVLDDSDSSSDSICYPPVTNVLQAIDDSGMFEHSTVLTFPAIIFADALHGFEITRVDQVPILDSQFYVDQVDMPVELAELFIDESIAAMD